MPLQATYTTFTNSLRKLNYPISSLDHQSLLLGHASAHLLILRWLLFDCSRSLATDLLDRFGLAPTNADSKLLETLWKIFRPHLSIVPEISAQKFLTLGFAQKKLQILSMVAEYVLGQKRKTSHKISPKSLDILSSPVREPPLPFDIQVVLSELDELNSGPPDASNTSVGDAALVSRVQELETMVQVLTARVRLLEIAQMPRNTKETETEDKKARWNGRMEKINEMLDRVREVVDA
jgi:hypothetical protein